MKVSKETLRDYDLSRKGEAPEYLDTSKYAWSEVEGYDGFTKNKVVHHRLENSGYSRDQLIEMGVYYKCAPCELICVSQPKHASIHLEILKTFPNLAGPHKGGRPMLGRGTDQSSKDHVNGCSVDEYWHSKRKVLKTSRGHVLRIFLSDGRKYDIQCDY